MARHRRSLAELLEALPEIYQPIFGHDEIKSSRTFQLDRFEEVRKLANDIADQYGRKLRLIDFGCAQGYLSIMLAKDGHYVVGVDYEQKNIDVCEALAYENSYFSNNLDFVCGDVATVLKLIKRGNFDVFLSFSVLHHLVFRDGFESTVDLVTTINSRVPNLIGEFALANEPLYWAEVQPQDPRFLLRSYPYIEQISKSQTHLSDIQRPILFCSREFVRVGLALRQIHEWHYHERPIVEDDREPRRILYCDDLLVKVVVNVSEVFNDFRVVASRKELESEVRILSSSLLPLTIVPPVLIDYKVNSSELVVVRKMLPGVPLSTCLENLSIFECETIVRQVTHQLATLEQLSLYHSDLRTWNVLWDTETKTASLIDFGAIVSEPTDVVPPHDPFYSYALFVQTVALRTTDQDGIDSARVFLDCHHMESQILDHLLAAVYLRTSSVKFFKDMHECLLGSSDEVWGSNLFISRWFSLVANYQNRRIIDLQRRSHPVE